MGGMNCCLITARARRWLENGRSPRILHLFAGVCNLVDASGEVLSLVSPAIGPGPFALVVEGAFPAALRAADPVRIDKANGRLAVGPLRVDTGAAAVWPARPDWSRLRSFSCPMPPPLHPALEAPLRGLLHGLQTADAGQVRAGAAALAGRGIGLTPAGDDVLLGVLFGLWVWQPRPEWLEVIVQTAVPRTTTLSAAFLRAAAAGEAIRPWHDLVNGAAGAIDRILAVGHTSGADAWAGFARTARLFGTG